MDRWVTSCNPPYKKCGMQIDLPGSYQSVTIACVIMITAQYRQSNKVCCNLFLLERGRLLEFSFLHFTIQNVLFSFNNAKSLPSSVDCVCLNLSFPHSPILTPVFFDQRYRVSSEPITALALCATAHP